MKIDYPAGLTSGFVISDVEPRVPELAYVSEEWAPARWGVKEHAHKFWEFIYCVKGRLIRNIRDRNLVIEENDLLVIPPAWKHQGQSGITGTHIICVGIDFTAFWQRQPALRQEWNISAPSKIPTDGRIGIWMAQIAAEVAAERIHAIPVLRSLVALIVVDAIRAWPYQTTSDNHPERVPRTAAGHAHSLIGNSPEATWTLAELAQRVGLSPNHLCTQFRREFGQTPRQYLIAQRLVRAHELLSRSSQSITEIAFELGFASSQHFAETCRKKLGRSPIEIRRGLWAPVSQQSVLISPTDSRKSAAGLGKSLPRPIANAKSRLSTKR